MTITWLIISVEEHLRKTYDANHEDSRMEQNFLQKDEASISYTSSRVRFNLLSWFYCSHKPRGPPVAKQKSNEASKKITNKNPCCAYLVRRETRKSLLWCRSQWRDYAFGVRAKRRQSLPPRFLHYWRLIIIDESFVRERVPKTIHQNLKVPP